MQFTSKSEAYLYVIFQLDQLKEKFLSQTNVWQCIEEVKIAFENHEQDPQVVAKIIQKLIASEPLTSHVAEQLSELMNDLLSSTYQQSLQQKFENPWARRSESELPIVLSQKPTKAMMVSVGRVSEAILKILNDPKLKGIFFMFAAILQESSHAIALGAFKHAPSEEMVKLMLQENNPDQFLEIMHIHFKFAQGIFRKIPLNYTPYRDPIGKLAEIIKEIWPGDPKDFFKQGISSKEGEALRSFVSDQVFYSSALYTAERNRGRKGPLSEKRCNQLGLMLLSQQEYSIDFPSHSSAWIADCRCQNPDLNSQYVKDLIENDAVYVSGPSGMTSLFLAQMEMLANFETVELKQNYLTAVVSYIVGGGFHSLHEVIGPAQYALDLIPGYQACIPEKNKLAPPPNYYIFYQQQMLIDPEFAARREIAWKHYLQFLRGFYESSLVISDQIHQAIAAEIDSYLFPSMNNNNQELSWVSNAFNNVQLTPDEKNSLITFKKYIKACYNYSELREVIEEYEKLSNNFSKKFKCCLEKVAEILAKNESDCTTKMSILKFD